MAIRSLRTNGFWHDGREVCLVRTPPRTPKGIGEHGEWLPTAKASGKRRARGAGLTAGDVLPELAALDAIAAGDNDNDGPKVKRNPERKATTPKRQRPKGRGPLRKSRLVWHSKRAKAHR